MRRIERESKGTVRPGQDLVIAGYAGLSGTVLIAERKREELLSWFSEDYINGIASLEPKAIPKEADWWKKYGATECEPGGGGGILKALWELSGAYMTGIRFSLRKIPIKQETIELCERYDLNPYRLLSTGCMILTADNGGDLTRALKEQGIDASVIGKVTGGIKRVIDHEGTEGFLDRPTEDELYRILQ